MPDYASMVKEFYQTIWRGTNRPCRAYQATLPDLGPRSFADLAISANRFSNLPDDCHLQFCEPVLRTNYPASIPSRGFRRARHAPRLAGPVAASDCRGSADIPGRNGALLRLVRPLGSRAEWMRSFARVSPESVPAGRASSPLSAMTPLHRSRRRPVDGWARFFPASFVHPDRSAAPASPCLSWAGHSWPVPSWRSTPALPPNLLRDSDDIQNADRCLPPGRNPGGGHKR